MVRLSSNRHDRRKRSDFLKPNDLIRQPPVDLASEIELLRLCVKYGSAAIDSVCDLGLTSEHFSEVGYRDVFDALVSMRDSDHAITFVSLRSRLVELQFKSDFVVKIITELTMMDFGKLVDVEYYGRQLIGLSKLRDLAQVAAVTFDKANNREADFKELAVELESELSKIMFDDSDVRGDVTSDKVLEAVDRIGGPSRNGNQSVGLSSGLYMLDDMTNGFNPGDLVIIAARPSVGKTSLAMNFIEHCSIRGVDWGLFFSLEMSSDQILRRMVTSMAYVSSHRARSGMLRSVSGIDGIEDDWSSITRSVSDVMNGRFILDDRSMLSSGEIVSKCRRVQRSLDDKLRYVVVDFLSLVHEPSSGGSKNDGRNYELGYVSKMFKMCAKQLGVVFLVLCQLNRGFGEKEDERPTMKRLRDSGEIEQDADTIIMIHRPDYFEDKSGSKPEWKRKKDGDSVPKVRAGIAELIVEKNRNGPTGVVNVAWIGPYSRFENIVHGSGLYGR